MANQTCNPSIITQALGITATGPRTVIVPADPIIWDAETSYEYLTLVASTDFGQAYISKRDVPAGTELTNTEYWVPAASYNAQLAAIQAQLSQLSEDNEEFKSEVTSAINSFGATGLASFDVVSGTIVMGFLSGRNLTCLKSIATLPAGNDFCAVFKYNGYYYFFSNSDYAYTKDFKSFATASHNIRGPYADNATPWGLTHVPGTNAIVFCAQYKDGTVGAWNGSPTYYCRPYSAKFAQEEDGTLTFSSVLQLQVTGFADTMSYIDPDCIRKADGTYALCFKNEITDEIAVFTSSTSGFVSGGLTTAVSTTTPIKGWEAGKLYEGNDGSLNAMVAMYNYGNYVSHVMFNDKGTALCENTGVAIFKNITGDNPTVEVVSCDNRVRHPAYLPVDGVMTSAQNFYSIPQSKKFNNCRFNVTPDITATVDAYLMSGLNLVLNGAAKLTVNVQNDYDSPRVIDDGVNETYLTMGTNNGAASLILTGKAVRADFANVNLLNATAEYKPKTVSPGGTITIKINGVEYPTFTL